MFFGGLFVGLTRQDIGNLDGWKISGRDVALPLLLPLHVLLRFGVELGTKEVGYIVVTVDSVTFFDMPNKAS